MQILTIHIVNEMKSAVQIVLCTSMIFIIQISTIQQIASEKKFSSDLNLKLREKTSKT